MNTPVPRGQVSTSSRAPAYLPVPPVAPRMEPLRADGAYTGGFREWLRHRLGRHFQVPPHRDRQLWRYGLEEKPRGFRMLPRRWVVER
jgi:hypothetical protein